MTYLITRVRREGLLDIKKLPVHFFHFFRPRSGAHTRSNHTEAPTFIGLKRLTPSSLGGMKTSPSSSRSQKYWPDTA